MHASSFLKPRLVMGVCVGVLLFAGLVVLIVFWPHSSPPPPSNPVSVVKVYEGAPPILSISLNGTRKAEVFRGWPLFLEAGLFYPSQPKSDAPPTPLRVAAGDGPWS